MLSEDEIKRVLANENLRLHDIKTLMWGVRYRHSSFSRCAEYANSILPEAGDYLPEHVLRAFIRADLPEDEAAFHIDRNRAFFSRLADVLPDLLRHFEVRRGRTNLSGLLQCIDDCHNDYYVTAESLRKDRKQREALEAFDRAIDCAARAVLALKSARQHIEHDFEHYYQIYYQASSQDRRLPRHVAELIHELEMCSGVLEIVRATAASRPDYLILSGNDKRGTLVSYAYYMSTTWNGPKLVTTPGSEFSAFCSLLFEVVTGAADESLAGAINRFARSDERKRWDSEAESMEKMSNEDNFLEERQIMKNCQREIEQCEKLLENESLSIMARNLLLMKVNREKSAYEVAENRYGPRQVWLHQLNETQRRELQEIPDLDDPLADLDIDLGKARRARTANQIDY